MSKQLTMKAGVAMFATLALAVALAILAFGSYQPVGAQTVSDNVTRSFSATQVVTGGTVDVTIAFAAALDVVSVTETLPDGWSYQSVAPSDVEVMLSGQSITFDVIGGDPVTYTVMAPSATGRGTFSGTVAEQGGASVGGETRVTVVAAGTPPPEEPDMVELSTAKAGADVTITVSAMADNPILGGRDIEVTLEDFGIPSSIDDNDVILDGDTGSYYGNPADVSVSGDTITITLPTRVSGTGGSVERAEISDAYSIYFKDSAGLSNPTSAGDKEITVSDSDADDETSTVTIIKTASVDPEFVTRGGDATVTAKGLRDGTTTVYLVDDDGDRGAALGNGTADDGVVEIEIDTSGKALVADATADGDDDVGANTLRVIDSNDDQVGDDFMLGIKPTVELGSATAKRSADLEISVSDWYYGDIDRVRIAGLNAAIVGDDDPIDVGSDNKATFKVTVPSNVRTGDQEVKVYGDNDDLNTTSATATVNIVVLPLDVSPATVVPGQRVTITGSGFANSKDVSSISIGGVDIDVPDDADSTSSGRVAVTVTVPLTVGDGDKAVKLTVDARTGEGEIEVPEPSIELNPAESVPGSVISVRGTGFAADGRVEVKFDGDIEEVGRADGSGDVHIRLEIPSDAGVGTTNEVEVEVRSDDPDVDINATADHETPGPALTVPAEAQVGTLATISGSNFEPFTTLTVMIGGKDATPTAAETDKNGAFELEARVPRLSAGSHTITVEDGSTDENSVTETFEVVTTPIVSTPQEVFGGLGSNLVVVWHYDNATGTWSSYDPGAPAELNDLTGVSRGNIVWIEVTEIVEFQGSNLYAGWNLITLE